MNASHPSYVTLRGIFCLAVGAALFLHALFPAQVLLKMIVFTGGLVLIGYGIVTLNLHTKLNAFINRITSEKK